MKLNESIIKNLNEDYFGLSPNDMKLIENAFADTAKKNGYKATIYNDKKLGHGGFININENYVAKLIIFPYPQTICIDVLEKYETYIMDGKVISSFRKKDFTKVDESIISWVEDTVNAILVK